MQNNNKIDEGKKQTNDIYFNNLAFGKLKIVEIAQKNYERITAMVDVALERMGVPLFSLEYKNKAKGEAAGNRLDAGWDLVLNGVWVMPTRPGMPFTFKSNDERHPGPYQTYSALWPVALDQEAANSCSCYDGSHRMCKHMTAAMVIFFACIIFREEYKRKLELEKNIQPSFVMACGPNGRRSIPNPLKSVKE